MRKLKKQKKAESKIRFKWGLFIFFFRNLNEKRGEAHVMRACVR
jgi:hypothetical protein